MPTRVPYPSHYTCECGENFDMFWNGGELDEHRCSCGRKYYGEYAKTRMVILEPGEAADDEHDDAPTPSFREEIDALLGEFPEHNRIDEHDSLLNEIVELFEKHR